VLPLDPSRVQEHVHGHVGWLAALALLHPAILLRRTKRQAHLSVILATSIATLAGTLGVVLYPAYREKLRQHIFQQARTMGYLFERKEHLAFGAVFLAWAGALAYFGAMRLEGQPKEHLRRAAHWAFVAAAALCVVTAVLGTLVAAFKTF
jgi:hypothetical protein